MFKWKECPSNLSKNRQYTIDRKNSGAVTKSMGEWIRAEYCTIIGDTPLPLEGVILWNINVLKSRNNDGKGIYIGVAPSDINQESVDNYKKYGWYFDCYESMLYSGPPHKYCDKPYGPRKGDGKYVQNGDSVGVVMDTSKGDISFYMNNVNFGIAYKGIPLDKPLVACVIIGFLFDSVELESSGVKENVDKMISPPFNTATEALTCDSITLTWNSVAGASFYQIEVDGSPFFDASLTNTYTKVGFLPNTEHSFRMRTVRDNSVSEWCDIVIGKTFEAPDFSINCVWRECPENGIEEKRKYSVDKENPKIAIKSGENNNYCTIIGNVPFPLNQLTSWNIKILKSKDNNGRGIYIGITPSDIDLNEDNNHLKCGWYFYCCSSTLCSGLPHNYKGKEYGPRNGRCGEYVHSEDCVSVIMDTTKGELSFVLNEANYGVAYEGIPLDKPLVPCVILYYKGDSVELDTSGVKKNVMDKSILAPANITTKYVTWNSITLAWDPVEGATSYQIKDEDGNNWGITSTNHGTIRGLESATGYNLRLRTVKGDKVSEWGPVVREFTQKHYFEFSSWKESPDYIVLEKSYIIDEDNPKIATNNNNNGYRTIICNTPLPLKQTTTFGVKILKSSGNCCADIFVGIAPFDIDQNAENNSGRCGWYFNCCKSTLWSGPPHNYKGKEYIMKKEGKDNSVGPIRTGDVIGVEIDTAVGNILFIIKGVKCDIAYEEVPLDKPLVPCVLLYKKDDSVELISREDQLPKQENDVKGEKDKDCIIS